VHVGTSGSGAIVVGGQLLPARGGDALDVAHGVVLGIADGAMLDVHVAWAAADCRVFHTGRTRCRSADGHARVTFKPSRGPGFLRMAATLRKLTIAGPVVGPLEVRVADDLTRIGRADRCRVTTNGLQCRQ
jgi:hypothetical protein